MIKLEKDKWESVRFGDFVDHYEKTERDKTKRALAKYVSVEHLATLDLRVKGCAAEEQPTFSRTFKKGHILFAKRRAYQKKVAIADFEGICSPHIWVLETKNGLNQNLLPFIMQRDVFYEYVNAHSAGTMSHYLKWPALAKYEFKLPPKAEQEKILRLFLTLEQQITQTEQQVFNLKQLKNKLVNDLVNLQPKFGNLIQAKNYKVTNLGEAAKEVKESCKTPLKEGIERFVGLEHIKSGSLHIQGWGQVADGTTFTKVFQNGDVLFGKRRAYLKKAALADFRGLCSGDILVLRANSALILPELFPYYASADALFEHAVKTSAGSLSPRTKWKDLAKFQFAIPDLTVQKKVLSIFGFLQKIIETNEQQANTLHQLKHKLLDEILG